MSAGNYDPARVAIDEVVENAKTLDEKLTAFTHRVMCFMSETSEYGKATEIGVEILSKFGIQIPLSPTKAVMAKEEMKYKLALRNRSISFLANLPIKEDPLLALCQQINICAMCKWVCFHFNLTDVYIYAHFLIFVLLSTFLDSNKLDILKLLNWKIIHYVQKKGSISTNLAPILGAVALMHVKQNDVKKANEYATAAQVLIPRIREDRANYSQTEMVVCYAISLLQSFRSLTDPFLQCYKDLKVSCC